MNRLSRTFVVGALALSVLAGCATGDSDVVGGERAEITVGVVAPQSGFAANYGPEAEQGIQMALDEAGGKAGDVEITVVTVDEDVLDPSQTLERVKQVVERDGAEIVIGPVFGSSQQAVAPYLSQKQIPMFSFLGAESSLAEKGSAIIWPGADQYTAGPLGTYAAEELGYDTIATIAPDYAYGHNVIAGIVAEFQAAGGQVSQQQWVPLGTTDMLQYATALDRSVDAVVMWLVPADAAAFVREYRNLGIDIPLLLFQGVFDPTYQEIGSLLVGEIGLNEYNHLLDYPRNKEFVAAYESRHGGIPNQTTAFAYTVMQAVIEGLSRSGGDPTIEALRSALAEEPLQTVIGEATFSESGIASSNRVVVKSDKAADGSYVWTPVKTYESIGDGKS